MLYVALCCYQFCCYSVFRESLLVFLTQCAAFYYKSAFAEILKNSVFWWNRPAFLGEKVSSSLFSAKKKEEMTVNNISHNLQVCFTKYICVNNCE